MRRRGPIGPDSKSKKRDPPRNREGSTTRLRFGYERRIVRFVSSAGALNPFVDSLQFDLFIVLFIKLQTPAELPGFNVLRMYSNYCFLGSIILL